MATMKSVRKHSGRRHTRAKGRVRTVAIPSQGPRQKPDRNMIHQCCFLAHHPHKAHSEPKRGFINVTNVNKIYVKELFLPFKINV